MSKEDAVLGIFWLSWSLVRRRVQNIGMYGVAALEVGGKWERSMLIAEKDQGVQSRIPK